MKKFENEKQCESKCPKCNSSNLDYGCSDAEGYHRQYPFICLDCGCEGREWYKEIYQETEYNE